MKLPDLYPYELSPMLKRRNKILGIINVVLGSVTIIAYLIILFLSPLSQDIYLAICNAAFIVAMIAPLLFSVFSVVLILYLMITKQKVFQNFGAVIIIATSLFFGSIGIWPIVAIVGGILMLVKEKEK